MKKIGQECEPGMWRRRRARRPSRVGRSEPVQAAVDGDGALHEVRGLVGRRVRWCKETFGEVLVAHGERQLGMGIQLLWRVLFGCSGVRLATVISAF